MAQSLQRKGPSLLGSMILQIHRFLDEVSVIRFIQSSKISLPSVFVEGTDLLGFKAGSSYNERMQSELTAKLEQFFGMVLTSILTEGPEVTGPGMVMRLEMPPGGVLSSRFEMLRL